MNAEKKLNIDKLTLFLEQYKKLLVVLVLLLIVFLVALFSLKKKPVKIENPLIQGVITESVIDGEKHSGGIVFVKTAHTYNDIVDVIEDKRVVVNVEPDNFEVELDGDIYNNPLYKAIYARVADKHSNRDGEEYKKLMFYAIEKSYNMFMKNKGLSNLETMDYSELAKYVNTVIREEGLGVPLLIAK